MAKKIVPIRYTSRDFTSIKQDLLNYTKKYYPNTSQDFNEGSFGSLMLDYVAYVGDIMSYYLDYQANESFLDTAIEYDNIVKLGNQLGYKQAGPASTTGIVAMYFRLPSDNTGKAPDYSYLPVIKRGTSFSTSDGKLFSLLEDVVVTSANSETKPATIGSNATLTWAVKTYGKVISGKIATQNIIVSDFAKFRKLTLDASDITEIISVFDSNGNQYYEVDYLSQNIIYKSIANIGDFRTEVPYILKPFSVVRRFTVNNIDNKTYLQFGAASDNTLSDSNSRIADPSQIVLDMYGRDYVTDTFFDPTKLLTSDKLGIGPENTTLEITYRYNSAVNSNAPAGAVSQIVSIDLSFQSEFLLDRGIISGIRSSFIVENIAPIVGQTSDFTADEIKTKIYGAFASQGRAVTDQDYKSIAYQMPAKFGKVKRVAAIRDTDELRRNINMYIISEDDQGFLIAPNTMIKNNLKTWVNKNKMISDTIDILDAKIVNFGIEFSILTDSYVSKYDVLSNCIKQLQKDFTDKMDIGEPLYMIKIYDSLRKVNGVADVRDVKIKFKSGIDAQASKAYSQFSYDMNSNMSPDGRYLGVPKNVILELKYLNYDIIGNVV